MQFPAPLSHGVLVSRYKRFFADVTLDSGEEITAHCANPGAMLGLCAWVRVIQSLSTGSLNWLHHWTRLVLLPPWASVAQLTSQLQ